MKFLKLKFKKIRYGNVISMGGYTYISNDTNCLDNPAYNSINCW